MHCTPTRWAPLVLRTFGLVLIHARAAEHEVQAGQDYAVSGPVHADLTLQLGIQAVALTPQAVAKELRPVAILLQDPDRCLDGGLTF